MNISADQRRIAFDSLLGIRASEMLSLCISIGRGTCSGVQTVSAPHNLGCSKIFPLVNDWLMCASRSLTAVDEVF
jgi:hypothetical protein